MVNIRKWENKEFSADQLAVIAATALSGGRMSENPLSSDGRPDVRLIRYYQNEGILSRPERRGKEAVYGYRHLLQLVAARVLASDGWPLKKIAEHFALLDEAGLLALIPGQEPNSALNIVRRFIRGPDQAALQAKGKLKERSKGESHPPKPGDVFRQHVAQMSTLQADLRGAMRRLGLPEDTPPAQQVTLIAIGTFCQLIIETKRLKSLTADEAEEIGRAVAASLVSPEIRKDLPS